MARLAIDGAFLIVVGFLVWENQWFLPAPPATALPDGTPAEAVVDIINMAFRNGLLVVLVINAVQIVRQVYRFRHRHASRSPDSAAARA